MTGISFDEVYARYERSPWLRNNYAAVLDRELPPAVEPFSHVPLSGLREVAAALAVARGEALLDLACGRGGPGLWIARATGTHLTGVDASALAVARASARAGEFAGQRRCRFLVGDVSGVGLAGGSADGVLCIDGFQFAADPPACAREALRVLRPGRRFVLTSWQPRRPGDPALPAPFRGLRIAQLLAAAGFTAVQVHERPKWERAQRRVYEAALAAGDPGTDDGLAMLQDEARVTLTLLPNLQRVLIVARRP